MVNSIITANGKKKNLYRAYTASLSTTQYLIESQFSIGINQTSVGSGTTALDYTVPITDGTTNDDGSNTMTGSTGGDNSTDNTTTYKQGAGNIDDTAQNLIKNDAATTAYWTISDLTSAGIAITITEYAGFWLYIKDATALAKFRTSSTAVNLRLGSDTSNYYYKNFTAGDLVVGWNWLPYGIINTLSTSGSPTGTIDYFVIQIITNNATDEFVAGDVVYDLLRQWEATDLVKDLSSGYPSINLSTLKTTIKAELTSLEANGFLINAISILNKDTAPIILSVDLFTGDSKSRNDEFAFYMNDALL